MIVVVVKSETSEKKNTLLTILNKVKLRIMLIFIFTHYVFNVSPSVSKKSLGLSYKCIRDIGTILGNWIAKKQLDEDNSIIKFGGCNSIIEIDESCFFKRKYNRGRMLDQVWVFGLVDRFSGRLFAQVVEQRNADTLIPIIVKYIRHDTELIVSDEWKSYSSLTVEFNHQSVKHKIHFVDPNDRRIHTQTIENRWGQMKRMMKKHGRVLRTDFHVRLKDMVWRIQNHKDIQNKILKIINSNNFKN